MRWAAALLAGVPIGLAAALGAPAAPANAHAVAVSTTPAQGTVTGTSPRTIVVVFNEPVKPVPGRTQVLAPDGSRIDAGSATVTDTTLTIPITSAKRPLGSYLVSYRVVSADSHPIGGAFTFAVGAPSATRERTLFGGSDPPASVEPVSNRTTSAGSSPGRRRRKVSHLSSRALTTACWSSSGPGWPMPAWSRWCWTHC